MIGNHISGVCYNVLRDSKQAKLAMFGSCATVRSWIKLAHQWGDGHISVIVMLCGRDKGSQ